LYRVDANSSEEITESRGRGGVESAKPFRNKERGPGGTSSDLLSTTIAVLLPVRGVDVCKEVA
jgi:hypothetical protein